MNKKALCLITFNPNEIYLDFLNKFINYDIYVIIDDNENNCSEYKTEYNKINFIQINNIDCSNSGFINTSSITINKEITGWDKALYYFSNTNCIYDYVWFLEDDVYFYDETTLNNIDDKYNEEDILCNSSFEEAKLDEWLWNRIEINFPSPYYCGMMCITRFSKNMIQSINDYAKNNNTLFFLEALYPTIAVKNNLKYCINPIEFLTITHRNVFEIDSLNKINLYHPIKKIESHTEARLL
jgi:hypothetical protein